MGALEECWLFNFFKNPLNIQALQYLKCTPDATVYTTELLQLIWGQLEAPSLVPQP